MKKLITISLSLLLLTACTQQAPQETTETIEQTEAPSAPSYTMDEVAKHADEESCWTVVGGKIYDLTDWISTHPGGAANILKICGTDGTEAFTAQHENTVNAQNTIKDFYLSDLQ